jgi:WXXGXW repeat (2 copies)
MGYRDAKIHAFASVRLDGRPVPRRGADRRVHHAGPGPSRVAITAKIAPPLLPVYAQPPIPGPGYLWIPGYWAWDGQEYYWTPGYWSMPPTVGFYWTPPYWGWLNGAYVFNAGYWGPTVGFYGGINYGFGYNGVGYQGGMWQGNTFVYNRTVNNFGSVNIANSYSRPVANPGGHVAFNGGNGGTTARPTQAQIAARTHGAPPTAAQMQHQEAASKEPALGFKANQGKPPITAMQRPNEFHGAAAATNAPAEHPQAAAPAEPARPQVAQPAAPAPQHYAYHAPAARPHVAYRAPAAHPHVAYHAPAARPHVAYRPPVARPQFAYRAPAMHAPALHAAARSHVSAPEKRTP